MNRDNGAQGVAVVDGAGTFPYLLRSGSDQEGIAHACLTWRVPLAGNTTYVQVRLYIEDDTSVEAVHLERTRHLLGVVGVHVMFGGHFRTQTRRAWLAGGLGWGTGVGDWGG